MSTSIVFRRATGEDLPAIVTLLADDGIGQGREDASLPLAQSYLDAFAAIEVDQNQFLSVADDSGTVVGTLMLTFIPGISRRGSWRGQIEAVRIAASQRGAGLGQRYFAWAIDHCRARGCALVQLTSDKTRDDAHRFYDSLGFVPSHQGYKLKLLDELPD